MRYTKKISHSLQHVVYPMTASCEKVVLDNMLNRVIRRFK